MPLPASPTSVRTCDDRSAELFESVQRLEEAMLQSVAAPTISAIVKSLRCQLNTQFDDEERLMQLYEYPLCDMHQRRHHVLRSQLSNIECLAEARDTPTALQFLEVLRAWLKDHVDEWDARLECYLNTRVPEPRNQQQQSKHDGPHSR